MESKVCPICKIEKPIEDYHRYFSKSRQKYRLGNYCIPCAQKNANQRAKEHYKKNKVKILNYQNTERKDWKKNNDKEQRDRLSDRYVLNKLKQTLKGESNKNMRSTPEIIEAKRTKILTSRIIKKLKNGKK
jgi:hypothetical protein